MCNFSNAPETFRHLQDECNYIYAVSRRTNGERRYSHGLVNDGMCNQYDELCIGNCAILKIINVASWNNEAINFSVGCIRRKVWAGQWLAAEKRPKPLCSQTSASEIGRSLQSQLVLSVELYLAQTQPICPTDAM